MVPQFNAKNISDEHGFQAIMLLKILILICGKDENFIGIQFKNDQFLFSNEECDEGIVIERDRCFLSRLYLI